MGEARSHVIRLLAFDFGLRTIGVAVGQSVTNSATALPPLVARDGVPEWGRIDGLIKTWSVNQLIVGLPLNMDDTESPMSSRARAFARMLEKRWSLPVALADERLTSREALAQAEGDRDAAHGIAAVLIAQTWLGSRLGAD